MARVPIPIPEKIEAQIIEVNSESVSYKKANYLDGPAFSVKITEISSIIYANGDVQAFNSATENTAAATSATRNTATSPLPQLLENRPEFPAIN